MGTIPLRPTSGLDDPQQKRRDRETINDILTFRADDWRKRTAAEISAGITPTNFAYPPLNVLRYGANTTPGTTDMASAIQAAINVAVNQAEVGGEVYIPEGNYRVNTTLSISGAINGIRIRGAGADATRLTNGVTGTDAQPCISITSSGAFFVLEGFLIAGNGLTTSSGNGNAISLINPGVTLAPQVVSIRDVVIRDHAGTGRDDGGNSIPSCGIYAFDSTSFVFSNVVITGCDTGIRFDTMEDCELEGVVIDDCNNQCVYLDTSHAIHFSGCTLQNTGAGAATDGGLYFETCESITFDGGEIKNCNPYLVNGQTSNIFSHNILLKGAYLDQLDSAMGHTAIRVSNGVLNFSVENCHFLFVNTITDAKGVEVIQNFAGLNMTGLRVIGNNFRIGAGGTISACVHLNVTSNRVHTPLIESNSFGFQTSIGSATTITDAILLEGRVEGCDIRNNTFATTTNLTITDAIHINSANVLALRVLQNQYGSVAGTVTNQVNNSAGVAFTREDRQYVTRAVGTGTINNGATSATITHGLGTTPQRAHITVTLGENPTNTPGAIWVDTITSTQFNVNCENDPGGSNLDFSWRAEITQPFAFP